MEIVGPGIAVFENIFLRNEEVIELSEESESWRPGTAGNGTDPKVRITDIHDLDPQTELHQELLDTFIASIHQYVAQYRGCRVTKGEHLRVGRYGEGGHYAPHSDSTSSERILSAVLYLNEDYEGGELKFTHHDVSLKPKSGSLVLFPSNYIYEHASLPVSDGKKYIVLSWFS